MTSPKNRRFQFRPGVDRLEGRALLAAGALDPTFGGTGMVITNELQTTFSPYMHQGASGVVIQPDLKTVIVGTAGETYKTGPGKNSTTNVYDIVVTRYNVDGSLDSTFGTGGVVRIRNAGNPAGDTQLALQPDGRIVVASDTPVTFSTGKKTSVTRRDLYVARLNPNGSFDTTFNGTGSKLVDFSQGDVNAAGVALQPDGKIVLGGDSTANDLHFLAVRLNPNGALDTSFGGGKGYVGISSGTAQGVTLDGSGDVILYGHQERDSLGDLEGVIVRYTPAGVPDPTFGTGGKVIPTLPGYMAFGNGIATATDQILLGDNITNSSGFGGGGVVRINADGSVDTTFGTGGAFTDALLFNPGAIALQPDGKILLAGKGPHGGSHYGYFVDRLSASGQLDTTFGDNGQAQAFFSGLPDAQPGAMAVGPDGKITVTGFADDPNVAPINFQIATARFLNDAVLTATMTTGSSNVAAGLAPSTGVVALAPPPDGPDVLPGLGQHKKRD